MSKLPESLSRKNYLRSNDIAEPVPWHVAVGFNAFGHMDSICGGTILDTTTILTSAQCIVKFWFPRALYVLAGSKDLKSKSNIYAVSEIIRYEEGEFNHLTRVNDIVILKLKEPIKANKNIRPVCLPNETLNIQEGKECFVSGWGHIAYSGIPKSPFKP